jgi:hypothetical protein
MARRTRRRRPGRPEFSTAQVLAWADAYRARTGTWPHGGSGAIADRPEENWRRVDTALRLGLRGLPGGSSLAQLLAERRQVRNRGRLPPLRPQQVLAWADAHRRRTGAWPTAAAGPIPDAPGETWRAADQALRVGARGLPGGSSLARLLAQRRGARNLQRLPPLTVGQVLAWADPHRRRTGAWPTAASGPIPEAPGETWSGVNAALTHGRRGLPGGSSLPRQLAAHRGARHPKQLPALTVRQILAWARAHRRRTGQWPTRASGPIAGAAGETWSGVGSALATGCRGLPGGLTLAGLLAGPQPAPRGANLPRLSVPQVLAWADAHHARTGAWPGARSGAVAGAPGETWRGVDHALRKQQRGLRGGVTLVQLLAERRGLRTRYYPPRLHERQVLAWADAHRQRTGTWPTSDSGAILGAAGETWRGVDEALRQGARGLRRGGSLARLLAAARGARNRTSLPPLRLGQVLGWAAAHRRRTGAWPTSDSGPVAGAPGETWKGVDMALRQGYRGLPGGASLARLLARRRGVRNRADLPRLTCTVIVGWARAHRRRTGRWPTRASGAVLEAPGETWAGVEAALRQGYRGLPGGSSLVRLCR